MTDIKIKIVKDGYRDIAALKVKCSQDAVPLKVILEALKQYKDKDYLNKAFDSNNVAAFAKIGHYYHPLGNITKSLFDKYLNTVVNN